MLAFHRVYYCGNNSIFDDTCSRIVNYEIPNFRWVFFFDSVRISSLECIENGLVVVTKITCGAKHCAFQLSNNSVYVVGSNEVGQVGMGKNTSVLSCPQRLIVGNHSITICKFPSTQSFSSSTSEDESSYSSSDDIEETPLSKKRKFSISSQQASNIISIKCSYDNTVLRTADGFVYASGDNEYQQITSSKEDAKVYKFSRVFFKELPLDQYKNIREVIIMDNYMLALTQEGRLYISEGNHSFEKMGLNIEYFNTIDFPQNSIVQIFKTSYAFFVKTLTGEIFYLQHGLSKMVKSKLLSYNDFIIGSGRYHVVSISTNLTDLGTFEAIGYNKFGNLGFRSSEETVKIPQNIQIVTNWIRSKSIFSCDYKLAADFFNTIVYRVKSLKSEASERFRTSILWSSSIRGTGFYCDVAIRARFDSCDEIGAIEVQKHEKKPIEKNGSFDEGTSNEQLNHIMGLISTSGNKEAKK